MRLIKTFISIILGVMVLSFLSCDEIEELTIFDIDYSETIIIESFIGINLPFNIITPAITTNSESVFEINDTRTDLIEEVSIKSLQLELLTPQSGDFDFLNSIEIYISADGLDEKIIAWKESVIENSSKTLILDISNEDFQEYIKKDEINLRVNTVTDELILSDHEIQIDAVFEVNAKILGI